MNPSPKAASDRPPDRSSLHPWSYRLVVVAGIPIYLHFSFLLLLVWLALGSFAGAGYVDDLTFVVAIFFCVALHEIGHSLVALHYRLPVSSITLYPIGGISRIERQPTPWQELWITLAGPAVNMAIATLLMFYVVATAHGSPTAPAFLHQHDWILKLAGANMILALFNLLPAFPMDGGRVLRAVLGLKMPLDRATAVAAAVGQGLAVLGGVFAVVTGQVLLMVVALFIYWGAGQEAQAARREVLVRNVLVREAMLTDVQTLPHGATFRQAADQLLATSQHDFPVVLGEEVSGLLSRTVLLRGLAAEGPDAYIARAMERDYARVRPDDDLGELLRRMQSSPGPALVFDGERLVGMVTSENLMEFLTIRQITAPPPSRGF